MEIVDNKALSCVAGKLLNTRLYTAEEILAAANPRERLYGVYFLIKEGRVVYVGQSHNVAARLDAHAHTRKGFDSYTYICCPAHERDLLESLYIHMLQPAYNGRQYPTIEAAKHAPYKLTQLLAMAKELESAHGNR